MLRCQRPVCSWQGEKVCLIDPRRPHFPLGLPAAPITSLLTSLSYVAALELRIEKLERRLAFARSRKASVANHEHDGPLSDGHTPQDRKDSLANIRAAIHRKAERKRENSDVNALISDFGYL